MLLKSIAFILSQLIRLITGTIKKGRTILLYRTIAPRKFTVKPMDNKREKEKKIQNQVNDGDFIPFVRQNKNKRVWVGDVGCLDLQPCNTCEELRSGGFREVL